MAGFRRFRNSLIMVSAARDGASASSFAYLGAARITGPVRRLADLVERARNGSYTGKVDVDSRDEIGTLAKTFNRLLADLREKEQLIDFLREETVTKKAAGVTQEATGTSADHGGDGRPHRRLTRARHAARRPLRLALRAPVHAGQGRHGRRLPRARPAARRRGGAQGAAAGRDEGRPHAPRPLQAGDQARPRASPTGTSLRTHDFGETDGTPYISMEYLEGVTLKDLIASKGALPIGVGLRIAKQMCQGLEAAHAQGVVHRDIKPQNMLILPETGDLKIMDFGIARVSEMKAGTGRRSGLTTAGTVMGTPDYMPPEQAQGSPADFRSDIYSLAVVLYEVFTGRLPFTADTIMKVVLAHIRNPPPPPRTVNDHIPAALEA